MMLSPEKDRLLKNRTLSLGWQSALRWYREVAIKLDMLDAICQIWALLGGRVTQQARLPGGLQADSGAPSWFSHGPGRQSCRTRRLESARRELVLVCLSRSQCRGQGMWKRRVGVRTNFADLHFPQRGC